MEIRTEQFSVSTKGGSEVLDITQHVGKILLRHKMQEGNVTVFVVGSTASITTTEFEPGLRKTFPKPSTSLRPRTTATITMIRGTTATGIRMFVLQ